MADTDGSFVTTTGVSERTVVLEEFRGPTLPRQHVPAIYDDRGELGEGGMGVVRRVFDPVLCREMALKAILLPAHHQDPARREEEVARFVAEAQITAQLEHPGVVPVHSLGYLPDGRAYFTMKEVRGRTLDEVIDEVHKARADGAWQTTASGWTFRRLIGAIHRAAEAVAYAHSRGVVHRDIKPKNIMVGDFGEVLVLDWGIAKVLAWKDQPILERLGRSIRGDTYTSHTGEVTGTPAYMAPEQLGGDPSQIAPPLDVYALGAVLYQALTNQRPYTGPSLEAILDRVREGVLRPVSAIIEVPAALSALCARAMARDPQRRFADGRALADALAAWLEGAERTANAQKLVGDAVQILPEIQALRDESRALRKAATAHLARIRSYDPIHLKEEAWNLEDRSDQKAREASLRELAYLQALQSALNLDPELPEAHERLSDHYQRLHQQAEEGRNPDAAARYEVLLRTHDRGQHTGYLEGRGALTLVTDPPGAEATLYRYVERQRRMVLEEVGSLGQTPIYTAPLQAGSYLVLLRAPGRATVRYPVYVQREEHWDWVPPGESEAQPIVLPPTSALGAEDVLVPAGWFWSGGDPGTTQSLPRRRLWVETFVIRRFPVTIGERLAMLNGLVDAGREDVALRLAPRSRGPEETDGGALMLGRAPNGHFFLIPDADGDLWDPRWPAFLMSWTQAYLATQTYAEATGVPWRLPFELEREKAARGVDGRLYPWGDRRDPTFSCVRDSHVGRPVPAVVEDFPVDESPYGVRGMAGGVLDWCMDLFRPAGPLLDGERISILEERAGADAHRSMRGGAYSFFEHGARISRHIGMHVDLSDFPFGYRLARSL